ncbi:MAG: glycosyltransferase family 39 protein [Anaerolineae bacterium]|nr:glycosyltransferase family 39 protein [Anaerolineae bacterium]
MDWYEPIRTLLVEKADVYHWLVPLLFGAAAAALAVWRRKEGLKPAALVVIAGVAATGQVYLGRKEWLVGGVLYASAGLALVLWLLVWRGDRDHALPASVALPRSTEVALIVALVLVATFARFYRLDRVPYGIEGDEGKWDVYTAAHMLGQPQLAYKDTPYSFWVEALAYRVFGISFMAVRYEVAITSVLATLIFYFMVKRILGVPGAFIAAFLLSISIFDISASRHGNVESHIKLPLILSFACCVYAVETQRWWWYLLTGLAAMLGLLAYDTYYPATAVIGLWIAWRLLRERGMSWSDKAERVLLYVLPCALVAPNVLSYLQGRSGYYQAGASVLLAIPLREGARFWRVFQENLGRILYHFSDQFYAGFLIHRQGPIINALLVPFAAMGLVYLTVRWRRGTATGLAPLWFLLLFFPVPLILGTPFMRIFYAALPALYILAAAGLLLVLRALIAQGEPGGRYRQWVMASLGIGLLLVGVNNLYVYFHELISKPDRVYRRQIVDLLHEHIAPGRMVYLPIMPRSGDLVEVEELHLNLAAWRIAPRGHEKEFYQYIPYDRLLSALTAGSSGLSGVTVIYDHGNNAFGAEREAIISAVIRCFPEMEAVQRGERFDVLTIPKSALRAPACLASVVVIGETPVGMVRAGQPVPFSWRTIPDGVASTATIEVARQVEKVVWLEAEDLPRAQGWYSENRFAPGFGGWGYLADAYRAPDAQVQVALPGAGSYTVWVRTYRRVLDDMPMTLTIAGRVFPVAQQGQERFMQWVWERLGTVGLSSGQTEMVLRRTYTDGPFSSLFIDALVLSGDPGYHPDTALWPLVFQSELFPARQGRFGLLPTVSLPSLEGRRWPVQIIAGDRLVDAVLVIPDDQIDLEIQEVWRILTRAAPEPAAQVRLEPGTYRWRVKVLDGERIVGPGGALGRWSEWTYFTVVPSAG